MKSGFHFTVKLKLILGFGILALLILIMYYLLSSSRHKNDDLIDKNVSVNFPSMLYTEKLKDLIEQTHGLVYRWTLQSDSTSAAKRISNEIDACQGMQLDSLKKQILDFVNHDLWADRERDLFYTTSEKIDSLFMMHDGFMEDYNEAKSQNNLAAISKLRSDLFEGRISVMYKSAFFNASKLANAFYNISSNNVEMVADNTANSFKILKYSILVLLLVILWVGINIGRHMITSL